MPRFTGLETEILERRAGIEPASPAWKAGVLPLHKRRDKNYQKSIILSCFIAKTFAN